jgi:hypothetical protein
MSDYSVVLFLHVAAALAFFMALGLEWASLRRLWGTTTAERAHDWLALLAAASRVGMVSMLTLVATGAYMMATAWGRVPWLTVALGALAPLPVLTLAFTRPRVAAIRRAIDGADGLLPAELLASCRPVLSASVHLRLGIALGIVFLMTVKPGFSIALTAMGVGAFVSLVLSLLPEGFRGPSPRAAIKGTSRLEA